MSEFNISKATQSGTVEKYKVGALSMQGPTGGKETEYMNADWSRYWGYFNAHADFKSAIIMKAIWDVGKGYTADPETEVILDHVSGWGKDTFDDILFNMVILARVNGDSFCEIIRDEDAGILINLKPLDPGSIKIIVDEKGIIKRYEQVNKIAGNEFVKKFEPKDIFHLSHNRLGDQIHGISDIKGMEEVLKAEEENFGDLKTLMQRMARPLIMFKIKTDIQTEIDAFISKMDTATAKGKNIYIPDDTNTVSYEVVQLNVSNLIMEWRNDIRNKFYRTIGLPQVVPGAGGQSTESESKVIYFAFEQIVEREQRYLEKQLWQLLQIRINLIPPATLSQQLQADSQKDTGQMNPQLNPPNKEE